MGRKPNGYWTFENCKTEGQKYSSRYEWMRNSRGSYNAARRNEWLDQIIPESHHTVARGHWDDFENCKAEGQKYSSRGEWWRNSGSSYKAARRNGWLDQIIPESRNTVPPGHWDDFENCKAEGQKYSSRSEWQVNSKGSYEAARVNGCISQIIPGTADGTTDNDAVYMYGLHITGVDLFKFGVTSMSRNTQRIENVARKANTIARDVLMVEVEDARDVERKLLELGEKQDFYKGDGYTEMRVLKPSEVLRARRIMAAECIGKTLYFEELT